MGWGGLMEWRYSWKLRRRSKKFGIDRECDERVAKMEFLFDRFLRLPLANTL
jgi:hypothetical protein